MTIRELFTKELIGKGMFPSQAEAVIEMAMRPDGEGGLVQMPQRIDDDLSGYPPEFSAVMILCIRRLALEWIDRELPEAWYRPMFV